jgi:hypothetical protein
MLLSAVPDAHALGWKEQGLQVSNFQSAFCVFWDYLSSKVYCGEWSQWSVHAFRLISTGELMAAPKKYQLEEHDSGEWSEPLTIDKTPGSSSDPSIIVHCHTGLEPEVPSVHLLNPLTRETTLLYRADYPFDELKDDALFVNLSAWSDRPSFIMMHEENVEDDPASRR